MSELTKYKVSIFGESYLLVSDESEEHIMTAAHLVDMYMRDIAEKSQITESKRIAILVALQLASKTLATKDIVDHQYKKSEQLIALIDQEITQLTVI